MCNIETFSFSVQIQNYHNHLLFKVDVKVLLLAEKWGSWEGFACFGERFYYC